MLPEHPLSSNVAFRLDLLDEIVEKTTLKGLRNAVESFRDNIIGVIDLLALPYLLLDLGAHGIIHAIAFALTSTQARLPSTDAHSEAERASLDKLALKMAEEHWVDKGHQERKRKMVHSVLAGIYQNPRGKSSTQVLLQSALVRAWSSLESLAEDLWEYSLNIGIDQLGIAAAERVLSDQESQKRNVEGLLAQSVQIHVLARYGWNISGKLGTLLKTRCDFTSVQGINRAFAVVFKDRMPVPQLRKTQELRQIELLRHVIVHRAGIFDEEYRDTTKKEIHIGSRLELTSDEAANAANLIIEEGMGLWSAVQTALTPSLST